MGNNLSRTTVFSEKGEPINGAGSTPNEHDMLTGSQTDGRAYTDGQDHTCTNWTSNGARPRPARAFRSHRWREHVVELRSPVARMQPAGSRRHGRRREVLLLRG